MTKRLIALFLSLVMVFSILPANVLAADGDRTQPEPTEAAEESESKRPDWSDILEELGNPEPVFPEDIYKTEHTDRSGHFVIDTDEPEDDGTPKFHLLMENPCGSGAVRPSKNDPAQAEVPASAAGEPVRGVYTGTCGDSLEWSLDTAVGLLEITGSGEMYDYDNDSNPAPWADYRGSIYTLSLPEGLTSIGMCAFIECDDLNTVTLPAGLVSVGAAAFESCYGLSSVMLPDSLATIGDYAFCNCPVLAMNIVIPASVSYYGYQAFAGSGVLSFAVDPGNEILASDGVALYNKDMSVLLAYPGGRSGSYTVPGSVKNLYDFSFCYTKLTSLQLPEGLERIGTCAVSNNEYLTSVNLPSTLTTLCDAAFYADWELTSITLPAGLTEIGESVFYRCGFETIVIEDGVALLGDQMFANCFYLQEITVPGSVRSIGNYAFYYCSSLTSLTIHEGVESLGTQMCDHCSWLAKATVPGSVQAIGEKAFSNCDELAEVILGDGLSLIGDYMFYNASSLSSVTIPDSVVSIGNNAFSSGYSNNLQVVTVGSGVTSIGANAFYNCQVLTAMIFRGDPPAEVGSYAFNRTYDLTIYYYPEHASAWAPNGETSWNGKPIEPYAPIEGALADGLTWSFLQSAGLLTISGAGAMPDYDSENPAPWSEYAAQITAVSLPAGLTKLGAFAFAGCTELKSVQLPAGLTSFTVTAFRGCAKMESISVAPDNQSFAIIDAYLCTADGKTLLYYPGYRTYYYSIDVPSTVTSIGEEAFCGLDHLSGVSFPQGLRSIGARAFSGTRISELNFPSRLGTIEDCAFSDCSVLEYATFSGNPPSSFGTGVFDGAYAEFCIRYPAIYASAWAPNGETEWNGYPLEALGVNYYELESYYNGDPDDYNYILKPPVGSTGSGLHACVLAYLDGGASADVSEQYVFTWMFSTMQANLAAACIPVGITEESYRQYVIDCFKLPADYWDTNSFEDFDVSAYVRETFQDYEAFQEATLSNEEILALILSGKYDGVAVSAELEELPAYTKSQLSSWYHGSWFSDFYNNGGGYGPVRSVEDGAQFSGEETFRTEEEAEESGGEASLDAYGLDFFCMASGPKDDGTLQSLSGEWTVTMAGQESGLSGRLVYGPERVEVSSDTVITLDPNGVESGLFAEASTLPDTPLCYTWFYALSSPAAIGLDTLIPVGMSPAEWSQALSSQAGMTLNDYFNRYPQNITADNQFLICDYAAMTNGHADLVNTEQGVWLMCAAAINFEQYGNAGFMGSVCANVIVNGFEDPGLLRLISPKDAVVPGNQILDACTLTVAPVQDYGDPVSYQWYRVGVDQPIAGATGASYQAPVPAVEGESYAYYCVAATPTRSGRSRDIIVTRTTDYELFDRVSDFEMSPDYYDHYNRVFVRFHGSGSFEAQWYVSSTPDYNGAVVDASHSVYTGRYYTECYIPKPATGETLYYYFTVTDYNALKSYRSNVFAVRLDTISTREITLTRLFHHIHLNDADAPDVGNDGIWQYVGAETYAYLYTAGSYSCSDSFTATFYRADDEACTQNVQELGAVTTDALPQYEYWDDAIFDLALKCRVPSDVPESYYVYAVYTNSCGGKTLTRRTNTLKVTTEDKTKEDYFAFDEERGAIRDYFGSEETVVFPSEIRGVPVRRLEFLAGMTHRTWASSVEANRTGFRNIVIPEGIEEISNYCFIGQQYLSEIILPDSVYEIGEYAFYRCSNVTYVKFGTGQPGHATMNYSIYAYSFSFSKLTSLELVDMEAITGTASIGAAFSDCPALTKIIGPLTGLARLGDGDYGTTEDYLFNPLNRSYDLLTVENIENIDVLFTRRKGSEHQYTVVPVYVMDRENCERADYDENFVYLYEDDDGDGEDDSWIIAALRRNLTDSTGSLEFSGTFKGRQVTRIGTTRDLYYYLLGSHSPQHTETIVVNTKRIVIQNGVKTIGENAFKGLYKLETVELPTSLRAIYAHAFDTEGDTSLATAGAEDARLTNINLNECSLSYVGEGAFQNQPYAQFGDLDFIGGAYIGDYAFSNTRWVDWDRLDTVTSITAHGNLSVGIQAFKSQFSLTSLVVDGALKLSQDAFDHCYYLENVSYQGQIVDGDRYDESRGFSHLRYTLAAPEVHESEPYNDYDYGHSWVYRTYYRVGDYGFIEDRDRVLDTDSYGNTYYRPGGVLSRIMTHYLKLEEQDIVIPSELNGLHVGTVDIRNTFLFINHTYTLDFSDGIDTLINTYKDDGITQRVSLAGCTSVRFPNTLSEIPDSLFEGGRLSGTVEIPASVAEIGNLAFARCYIDTLILHEPGENQGGGLKRIGKGAFAAGDVDTEYSVQYIDAESEYFTHIEDLHYQINHLIVAEYPEGEIRFPSTLELLEAYAFAETQFPGTVYLNLEAYGRGVFYKSGITGVFMTGKLPELIIGDSFGTLVSDEMFYGCENLKTADLRNLSISNLNEIYLGQWAFAGCSALEQLKLPRNLKVIDDQALKGVNPAILHFPEGLTEYLSGAGLNGEEVMHGELVLPESVTRVSNEIFDCYDTITFYNQSPSVVVGGYNNYYEGYTNVGDTDLPTSIREGCTIRCYEGSFIYNWCVANNLNYELIPDPPTTLTLQLYADDGYIPRLSLVEWFDLTDDYSICANRLNSRSCLVHELKQDHVYGVRVWPTSSTYENYDLDRGAMFLFDPSSEDFDTTLTVKIWRRGPITVVGSFGEQAQLDGFRMEAYIIKNDYTTNYTDQKTPVPVTLNEDGSFSATMRLTKANLEIHVAEEAPYLPMLIKNVAYKPKDENGVIDLGELRLSPERIVAQALLHSPEQPMQAYSDVTVYACSSDGSKYTEIGKRGNCLYLSELREDFSVGEEVVLQIYNPGSPQGWAPVSYTLQSEKIGDFNWSRGEYYGYGHVEMTQVQNAKVTMPAKYFPVKLGIYNAYGHLVAHTTTNTGRGDELYLPPGSYTLIAFQQSPKSRISLPDTLEEFLAAGYELAGCVQKEITLSAGEEYEFTDEIPSFVVQSAVTVAFTDNARLADKESGAYPVYLHYAVDEEARNGDISFRLQCYDAYYSPFFQVGDTWATLSAVDGASCEVSCSEENANRYLELTTNAYEGVISFYVRPTGHTLKLLINGDYKTVYTVPGMSFSVSKPAETAVSRMGCITLNYTNGVPGIAKVFADGEEIGSAELKVGAANKLKLDYTLPEREEESTWLLQVKTFNADGAWLWSSYEFPVTYSSKPVPVPKRMDIRIANGNAAEDGVPRVTNSFYDFSTGETEKMRVLILTENYNPDGTMAQDIEFSYHLHAENPELAAYGEIYLKVWCNENEPKIYPVTLSWNETSGTFDGKLLFPGGTRTVEDLPYGFDLEVPTEKTEQEINQEAIDAANDWGELLTAELDPEIKEFYEATVDIDEFRFLLENGEYIVGLTEEEKQVFRDLTEEDIQALVELAEAKNNVAEAYTEMTTVAIENMQNEFSEYLQYSELNEIFAAQGLNVRQTVPPEGTTPGMLLNDGYQEIVTNYGTFYIKREEEKTTATCLDPPVTYIIAQNSHVLNGSKGSPLRSGDPKTQFEESWWNIYEDFEFGYLSTADNIVNIISIINGTYIENGLDELNKYLISMDEKAVALGNRKEALELLMNENSMKILKNGETLSIDIGNFGGLDVDDLIAKTDIAIEYDNISKELKEINDSFIELLKDGPSNLPKNLQIIKKIATSPKLMKALDVIPMVGNVIGLILAMVDILEVWSEHYELIKRFTKDIVHPIEKWLMIYCLKVYTGGMTARLYGEGGGWKEALVGALKVNYPGNNGSVADYLIDARLTDAVDYNYILYYVNAKNGVKPFADFSDYYESHVDTYYSVLNTYTDSYNEYIKTKRAVAQANLLLALGGFIPHWSAAAFSFLGNIGMLILGSKMGDFLETTNARLDKYLYEEDQRLGELVNKCFDEELNLYNMQQVWQGDLIENLTEVAYLYRAALPRCCKQGFMSMGLDIEYFEDVSAAFNSSVSVEKLDALHYDFTGQSFDVPSEGEEPGHGACVDPQMDPSGYVYEAVASNRIEGATATVYYRDKQGNEQLWDDAEEYEEINPQITDSFGEYGWMTPIGKWKVYVEKEGYLPADSSNDPAAVDGWLPVPPPQLNVNIGLISTAAPEVTTVAAAADRLQITFSQYMSIADLEADPSLITVSENGANVPLCFTFADREESPTQEGVFYGRVLTITRTDDEAFTGNGLDLHVGAAFHNYAGTAMTADYDAQSIQIDQIVGSIIHDYSNGYVGTVGEHTPVTVTVLDTLGNPVAGETVTLSAAYGDLYQVESYTAVTDENGVAHFSVMAIHDGTERFTFTTPNGVSADVSAGLQPLVPPHEHSAFFVPAAEPTCTEPGHVEYWRCIGVDCELDGKYFADEEMTVEIENVETAPALGHDFVDGTCTRCGAADPDYHPVYFTDVTQNAYYYDPVRWAVENGVTAGTSDTTFSPNQRCTRAQIVTFLWRAAGSPDPTIEDLSFTDVAQTAYYYDAVRWALENGITSGVSESSFCPGRTCTRAEAMTFLWRAAGSPTPTQTDMPFSDVPGNTWYAAPVLWAVENNITVGTSETTFSPNQRCTRAQIVTFLWHTSQLPE